VPAINENIYRKHCSERLLFSDENEC